jgi:hypothetical protein
MQLFDVQIAHTLLLQVPNDAVEDSWVFAALHPLAKCNQLSVLYLFNRIPTLLQLL